MSLYAMSRDDGEVRLVRLDTADVLDIPDAEIDEAHELADLGEGDELFDRFATTDRALTVDRGGFKETTR